MTTAAKGVQKALARAGASVIAIAEMTADDLLANMSDEQKTALAASLTPAPAPTPAANSDTPPPGSDGDDDDADDKGKKPGEGGDGAAAAAGAPPDLAADPRVKTVAAAVATDDACKGKADLALSMLADDDYAGLSASGIVKLLGKTPASGATGGDDEAAARAAMQGVLSQNSNSKVDPNGGGKSENKQAATQAWDNVIARMNPTKAA